jgi:hypothetical protein
MIMTKENFEKLEKLIAAVSHDIQIVKVCDELDKSYSDLSFTCRVGVNAVSKNLNEIASLVNNW